MVDRAGREAFDVMERLARRVPVGVLCAGLGVGDDDLKGAVDDVIAVSAAWHPDAGAERRSGAEGATQRLTRLLGGGTAEATANRIGVLVQACDATAGLIGNALNLALRLPQSCGASWPVEAILADPHRFDPSGAGADAEAAGTVSSQHLTFGHGRRPCPGGDAALALAGGVVEVVLARCRLTDPHVTLEPSPNLRIPSRLEVARR